MIEYEPLPLHPALVPSGAPFAHACSLVMEGVPSPDFDGNGEGAGALVGMRGPRSV